MKAHLSNRSRSVFEQSLPIVAAALGRLCGVAIEFGGQVPATDGKTIYMPMPETMTEEDELKVLGILCHEAGHVRLTDFGNVGQKLTHLERAIDNALEDCRVEMAMSRLYPGAESLFEKAHFAKVQELADWEKFDEQTLVPLFLLAISEKRLLYRKWLTPLTTKLLGHMYQMFGKSLTEKLTALALEVRDAKNTQDVVAIRKQIMRLLKREAAKAETPKPNKGKDASAAKEAGSEDAKEHAPQQGAGSEDASTTTSCQEGSASTALQRVLQASLKPVVNPLDISGTFKRLRSDECVPGLIVDLTGHIRPAPAKEDVGRERLSRARKDSVALRLALRGLVQAKARCGKCITDRGRRFSTTHLSRLVVSDARVFEQRTECQAPNTAVHVLLDMSGSMGLAGGDLAVRTSLGLVLGLEGIRGVNPALSVFPGAACGHAQQAICTVLKHGERLTQVTPGQIGAISSWGGTPLQQALQAAGFTLAACREVKKALILITDGRVSVQETKEIFEELKKAGIHVLAIQIGIMDDLKRFPIDSAHISHVGELQQVLFVFAKKLLL